MTIKPYNVETAVVTALQKHKWDMYYLLKAYKHGISQHNPKTDICLSLKRVIYLRGIKELAGKGKIADEFKLWDLVI